MKSLLQRHSKYPCRRYHKPHAIHQSHVKALVEAPNIRMGSGKELRQLHDVVSRHVHSLRTIKGNTNFILLWAWSKYYSHSRWWPRNSKAAFTLKRFQSKTNTSCSFTWRQCGVYTNTFPPKTLPVIAIIREF